MPAIPSTEVLLGCDPQVRVVIIEDEGNLFLQVFAQDPANTDIDALFFNLADGVDADNLTIFPSFDEATGSNGLPENNITGFDVSTGSLNQLNNGAQIQESYDVRLEFGQIPYSSGGDVDEAMVTFFVDGGPSGLSASDFLIEGATVVVNSDDGMSGLALTSGAPGGDAPTQTPVIVTAVSESFNNIHDPDDSAFIESDGRWDVRHGELFTNGHDDGTLLFEEVATEGPVQFSFDARAENLHAFESGGHYGDSLRIEVQIDGGQWVLLDEFVVNHDKTALVGSNTGQTITHSQGEISYSGGILDTAQEDVQFRLVSDISASNEIIRIDNVEINVTEIVDAGQTEIVETTVAAEDFDGLHYASQSDLVAHAGRWDVQNGELKTDGCNDGNIWFEEVSVTGSTEICFDARAPHTEYFESGGCYGDSLEVWALVNGSEWALLDTFTVNHDGTALVGDTTGQTITATSQTLSYEGGVLENADTVQLVLDADISARNEEIFVDNVEIKTQEEVPVEDRDGEICEDFEAAAAGDVVSNQFDGFTVSAQKAGDMRVNDAMIFDTENPTGGDHDLEYDNQGNVIIISEDNDSSDPDDNAHGGTISFEFDDPSTVTSLTLLDIEEQGGTIELFDANGLLLDTVGIPAAGDNSAQDIAINTAGVATMNVNLVGSGAVDNLCYVPGGIDCGQYDVTYDDDQNNDLIPDDQDDTVDEYMFA